MSEPVTEPTWTSPPPKVDFVVGCTQDGKTVRFTLPPIDPDQLAAIAAQHGREQPRSGKTMAGEVLASEALRVAGDDLAALCGGEFPRTPDDAGMTVLWALAQHLRERGYTVAGQAVDVFRLAWKAFQQDGEWIDVMLFTARIRALIDLHERGVYRLDPEPLSTRSDPEPA